MGVKSFAAKLAASIIAPQVYRNHRQAVSKQQQTLRDFLRQAANTTFGLQHSFRSIHTHSDFVRAVPVYDYEELKSFIGLIKNAEHDVLWPGAPLYFCKSSGTTSGTKYIPLTKESIADQIRAARNSLMMYVAETGNADFFDHKMIFLQGSPELDSYGAIPSGRLSGIVYHHVPSYLNRNRMPSYQTNCIDDWETKVEAIARETVRERMSLISGIPPWVIMYFEKILELSGKQCVQEVFPDFKLFAYGGVNYEPYRKRIEELIGFRIDTVETFPASEGFVAYSDRQGDPGLLLNLDGGIFFEFVKAEDAHRRDAERLTIADVELGVNYAVVLTTNAGLWAYALGDMVKFVSKDPYRILVTGRVKHFISAFGEHVIAEEVEAAMLQACAESGATVAEFTVAPMVNPTGELSYHEWWVEFANEPNNQKLFAETIDTVMRQKNVYYDDLRVGNMLQAVKVRVLRKGAFGEYMKSQGKLGGQNKIPRLTNDRKIADALTAYQ